MPKTQHKSTNTPSKHNSASAAVAAPSVAAAASSSSSASASLARRHSRHLTTRSSVSMEKEKEKDHAAATTAPAMSASTSISTATSKGASSSSAASANKQSQSGPVVVKGYVIPSSKDKDKDKPKDPKNPTPWRHPAELPYICRDDWSQDLIIEYLCQKSFSVPGKEHSSAVQLIQVTPYRSSSSSTSTSSAGTSKDAVLLPRAYRVPLMFVAKFQWESLRLVLTSSNPREEWEEYKFDIVHISRLCQHLFEQAREAFKKASALNPSAIPIPGSTTSTGGRSGSVPSGFKGTKSGSGLQELGVGAGPGAGPGASALGMKRVQVTEEGVFDKTWRSPMFDRVLTRFYRKWFVSREWSLKNFYEEFDEEEYEIDVLKYDWARWAIKGHKGFALTKEEVLKGITAEQYMRGLGKTKDGAWTWVTPSPTAASIFSVSSSPAANVLNGTDGNATSNAVASAPQVLAQAEQAGNAPPSAITPTIPHAVVTTGPAFTAPTPAVVTSTPPPFSTVEVKREHLENGVIPPAENKEKKKEGGGDRELSDKFAMITHPSHSDPPPPPPELTPSAAPNQIKATKAKATTDSGPAASATASSSALVRKASTLHAEKSKTATSSVSTSPVIGKKRPREEEQDVKPVEGSVSAGPAQKQRRTMQTARKSMSAAQAQKMHRDRAMALKISSPPSEGKGKGKGEDKEDEDEEDSKSDSSSSSEHDDERDGDYKVRTKSKVASTGKGKSSPAITAGSGNTQKRKSSMNGGTSISATGSVAGKAGTNGSASAGTSGSGEREKKKAKLDTSASTSSPGKSDYPRTNSTAMKSIAWEVSRARKTSISGPSITKTTPASASASTSKPAQSAPKMMLASTEPVKKAPPSPAKAGSSSSLSAAVGSALAKASKPTTASTSKEASSSVPSTSTDPKEDPLLKAAMNTSLRSRPTRSPPPRGPVPGYGYIFSMDGIGGMNANLLGLNMSLIGQAARDGTGPQGGHIEAPIPLDIMKAMTKMSKWMRAPPKIGLELADPITKQAMRYVMADLGLGSQDEGSKVEKTKDDEGKEKAKAKEVERKDAKGKEKEVDPWGSWVGQTVKQRLMAAKERKRIREKAKGDIEVYIEERLKFVTKANKEKEGKEGQGPSNATESTPASDKSEPVKSWSQKGYTDKELIRWLERTYAPGMYEDEGTRDTAAKALVDKISFSHTGPPDFLSSITRPLDFLSSITSSFATPAVAASVIEQRATATVADASKVTADASKEVIAPATVVDSPSVDNAVLATTLPKSVTPASRSPSPASSMSISPSPHSEPELAPAPPSTPPPLPAPDLSSSTEEPPTAKATSHEVSHSPSPLPRPTSVPAVSPVIPPPIITPTLVHPPITFPRPVPPPITTHSPSITNPTPVRASTSGSPIISATSPSLKGEAMSTILSVLPSMPIQRRPSVVGAVPMTAPPVNGAGSPKVAAAGLSQDVSTVRAASSPAEKPAKPTVSSQQVSPAEAKPNGVQSSDKVDNVIVNVESPKTATSFVNNDNINGHVLDEQTVTVNVPAHVTGVSATPGARDMATAAELMVEEDLAGSRVLEGVPVGILGTPLKPLSAAGTTDDRMDVDAPVVNGAAFGPTSPIATANVLQPVNGVSNENASAEYSVGLLMADGTRSKSLHTILLLRDLLQFLRIPGWGTPARQGGDAPGRPGFLKGDGANHLPDLPVTDTRAHYALLEGEETMTIEQRVDILAHASIALAKALFPFRGSETELETRISALDSRLQEQFRLLLKPEERERATLVLKEMEKNVEKEEKNDVDETQKSVLEEKGVQTSEIEKKDVLSSEFGIQTEAEEVPEPVIPVVEVAPRAVLELGIQTEDVEEGQGREEEEERKFGDAAIQTEQEVSQVSPEISSPVSPRHSSPLRWAPHEPRRQPSQLTPDATMVDFTSTDYPALQPKPPVSLQSVNDISKMLAPAGIERTNPATKAMMSIMRNIADLIEYSAQDDSTTNPTTMSAKGKEREVSIDRDVEMSTAVEHYSGSPVVDAIVSEFRAMKEELRIGQQKTREELDSIRALHRSGIEQLESEPRSKAKSKAVDETARDEVQELKRQHQEEVEQLRETIRKMERDKEKARDVLEEERIPALELLELRRRITSLESRSRLEAETPGGPTPGPPPNASPAPTHLSESSVTLQRHTSHHPLGHLLTHDLEETGSPASPIPGRSYIRDASTNPGTPLSSGNPFSSRQADGMDVEEVMPLPIKSQRKMHMMMFPRPSVG